MDRASAENLIFLLKIISTIFDLKRVVYVLSYDKERLNDILEDEIVYEYIREGFDMIEIESYILNEIK